MTFQEAKAAAADDETVCGVLLLDGTPAYFVMAADASDVEVRARAFELRHGRAMSHVEVALDDIARRIRSGMPLAVEMGA